MVVSTATSIDIDTRSTMVYCSSIYSCRGSCVYSCVYTHTMRQLCVHTHYSCDPQ